MLGSLDYQFFNKYFSNFKKFDARNFDLALQHVENYSTEHGLSEEDLILISKVTFNQENLGTTRLRKVMKCLIPRRSVPDEVVEYVMDWLLQNYNKNISPFSKKIVLQWLIGIIQYNLIDPAKTVNLYYELFWYFLPYQIVNVPACHLIYLLAKPEDVSRWYVKQILKIHNLLQQPKYTGALLLLFKSYRPNCVPENIPAYAVHKAFGALPEFIITKFSKAQEIMESQNMIFKNVEGFCWYSQITKNVKRNAVQLIPKITECETLKLDGSKTLTSITDFKSLHKYLIENNSPTIALSLLNCKEGFFILIYGDKNLQERFSYQLYYTLYDAFLERNPYVSYEEKENLLEKIALLQNVLQQNIPVVSKFLQQFLIQWDGMEHENHIYDLLHWINFPSFDDLNVCILSFLYDLFISGTVMMKNKILRCLGQLCVNIILTHFNRQKKDLPFLFLSNNISWNFEETISEIYEYLQHLFLLALNFENANSIILHTMIEINYMIMDAEQKTEIKKWNISKFMCYSVLFSPNPSCLIMLCVLFNRFFSYVDETIKRDFANALFYRKAFPTKDKESIFCILPKEIIQKLIAKKINVNSCLSFEKHLALACFNFNFKPQNKNFKEFLQHANKNYPEVMTFLNKII